MAIRLFRTFWGGYAADTAKLNERKFKILRLVKPIISATNTNHGFGRINGTTKKLGANYSPVPVCLFRRNNRQLLWETKSKADGSYAFRNIALGLECFVVAFDPNNEYNAVIQDKLTPFDGRVG